MHWYTKVVFEALVATCADQERDEQVGERRVWIRGWSGWHSSLTPQIFDPPTFDASRSLHQPQGLTPSTCHLWHAPKGQACPCRASSMPSLLHSWLQSPRNPTLAPTHSSHSPRTPSTNPSRPHGCCTTPELVDRRSPSQIYPQVAPYPVHQNSHCQLVWAPLTRGNLVDMFSCVFGCRYVDAVVGNLTELRRAAAVPVHPQHLRPRHRVDPRASKPPGPSPLHGECPRWAKPRPRHVFVRGTAERERGESAGRKGGGWPSICASTAPFERARSRARAGGLASAVVGCPVSKPARLG